jgi:GTPase SAR1 family protein
MGILLVYDVTDEASFNNIRNWMRNIEQHASDNVNKVQLDAWPVAAWATVLVLQ